MNIITLVIDVLLTIPLSLILIKIERKKNNFLYMCLIPAIYIILLAAFIPIIKKNIYLIPIFEVFIRNFYITNVNEEINNNKNNILSIIISILLSIITYSYFINKVSTVLPSPEEIKNIIWIMIIVVIYSCIKNNTIQENNFKSLVDKPEYITMQYAKYKIRYQNVINSKNTNVNKLVYSLLIYKSYQTPSLIRKIRIYINHLLNKEVKYGILEVSSPVPIAEEESISSTLKELEKQYKKLSNKDNFINDLLTSYNKQELEEIVNIYNVINNF